MTDSRLARIAVVLYEPQNPINIAGTIRAMKNMGVSTLRLVRPCAYDPVRLEGIAHDTRDLIDRIERYEDFDSAVADCVRLVGFTARRRAAKWQILDPRTAAEDALGYTEHGQVGIVFGREDAGLPNEILDRVHAAGDATRTLPGPRKEAPPATSDDIERFFTEAHQALDSIQFFKTRYPEHIMRSIRALTFRAAPDSRELSLLRAAALEVVRFLERTERIERTLPPDVSPRAPRHVAPRDERFHGTVSDDAED